MNAYQDDIPFRDNHEEKKIRKLNLLEIFKVIHKNMAEGIPYNDNLDEAFNLLDKIIPFDRMGIAILDESTHRIILKWVKSKMSIQNLRANFSLAPEKTSLYKVIQSGKTRIINDLEEYYVIHPNSITTKFALEDGIRSSLTCPIKFEGKTAGVIFFSSSVPFTYNKSHIDTFCDISEGLSSVLAKEILKEDVLDYQNREQQIKSIIHDLSNSLQIISATVDLIEKKQVFVREEYSVKDLKTLKKNCEIMNKRVHKLIYNQLNDEKEELEIDNFMNDLLEANQLIANNKKITLKFAKDANLPKTFKTEIDSFRKSAENLISNAIKFSPISSFVHVRLDFDEGKNRLYFTVSDSGPGIPSDEISQLFKFKGKTSVRPTGGESSSGTGLANVKRLVETQGGEVFVDSKVGIGSTFGFWIPLI